MHSLCFIHVCFFLKICADCYVNNAVLFDGQTVVPKRCHRSVCQAPSVANGCANDGSDAKGSAGADGCDLGQPVCESTRVGCVWLAVASITWQCLMSYFHAFIQTNSMIWDLNLECINEPKPTCLCCCLFGRDPTNQLGWRCEVVKFTCTIFRISFDAEACQLFSEIASSGPAVNKPQLPAVWDPDDTSHLE